MSKCMFSLCRLDFNVQIDPLESHRYLMSTMKGQEPQPQQDQITYPWRKNGQVLLPKSAGATSAPQLTSTRQVQSQARPRAVLTDSVAEPNTSKRSGATSVNEDTLEDVYEEVPDALRRSSTRRQAPVPPALPAPRQTMATRKPSQRSRGSEPRPVTAASRASRASHRIEVPSHYGTVTRDVPSSTYATPQVRL